MSLGTILRYLRQQARLAAVAVALTALSGCSLLFVEGPPRDHASRHFFDCTSSMVVPGMDAALTGALALSVLGVSSDQTHTTGDIVTQSALVVGALASATYGYMKVSRCREAKDDLAERLINMPYLGVPPGDASRAPPPRDGAPRGAPPLAASSPANAPAPRDPWLSEGPPPPPSDGRREPTLMPPPPPYLRVAPHPVPSAAPPPPPPPATADPPAPPPPAPAEPPPPPPPSRQAADPESP